MKSRGGSPLKSSQKEKKKKKTIKNRKVIYYTAVIIFIYTQQTHNGLVVDWGGFLHIHKHRMTYSKVFHVFPDNNNTATTRNFIYIIIIMYTQFIPKNKLKREKKYWRRGKSNVSPNN